jgi:tetratricopeptide (TPR) repeat protein
MGGEMVQTLSLCTLFCLPLSLSDGDQEFSRSNYRQAAAIYDSVLSSALDSTAVLWRLARVYVCMGDVAEPDEKLALYQEADGFAQRCIRADSTTSEGHTWRAAALGNIAMFEGGRTKVRLAHTIKHELDLATRLNPDDDVAYSILGSFYLALGQVSWIERQLAAIFLGRLPEGGFAEAEYALQKAVTIAPDVIRHHYELGRLYVVTDRPQEAIDEFRRVISLPVQMGSDEGTRHSAEQMIEQIQGG